MIEIDTEPLVTEVARIDYKCGSSSAKSLTTPQVDANRASLINANQIATASDSPVSIDSNNTEGNDYGKKVPTCPVCGRYFLRRWSLKQHMVIHSDQRPFGCPLCQKTCVKSYENRLYMLICLHLTILIFFSFRFKTNDLLRKHIKRQLKYECKICFRKFCAAIELGTHEQSPCQPPTVDGNVAAGQSEHFVEDQQPIYIESDDEDLPVVNRNVPTILRREVDGPIVIEKQVSRVG